jgi:hypothetical protein
LRTVYSWALASIWLASKKRLDKPLGKAKMIEGRLVELGREKAMDLLNEYGNKTCPECGHSNWAHGVNGCVYDLWQNPCPCKLGKSNEEIIFGKRLDKPLEV